MIVLGVILVVLGLLFGLPFVWWIGGLLIVIGLVLTLLGALGHAVGGHKTYY